MKLGFFGLGNLGMPFALGWAMKGHQVYGYDKNPARMDVEAFDEMEATPVGYDTIRQELRKAAGNNRMIFCRPETVLASSDVVFVTVQTPSRDTRPESLESDYDLVPLEACVREISDIMKRLNSTTSGKIIVIVSTVLPGTARKIAGSFAFVPSCRVVYNPAFCAMGTVIPDMFAPEFVLLGFAEELPGSHATCGTEMTVMTRLYGTVTDAKTLMTNYESAEMTKCCYNAFITTKINFANAVMELAHNTDGCDADTVMDTLKAARNRLISGRYLSGGMGDQGGCHIKEGKALSSLSARKELSYNWFRQNLVCRNRQTGFMLGVIIRVVIKHREIAHVWIMGKAFKPETNLQDESLGWNLYTRLREGSWNVRTGIYDPLIDDATWGPRGNEPAIFFIATKHEAFRRFPYPKGSVVVDPWRYVEAGDYELVRIGAADRRDGCQEKPTATASS